MMFLVLGTQNSGKSELAEELAMNTGDDRRYYLATMKVCDEEGQKRVEKHRAMREGKGFLLLEKPYAIMQAADQIEDPETATVLLECVSNLVGNELFDNPARSDGRIEKEEEEAFCEHLAHEILSDIVELAKKVHHLILVSNTYEKDAPGYDDSTRLYIRLLDLVNEKLIPMAEKVYDLRGNTL